MMHSVKRFSGLRAPKKINTVFMFFFLRNGRFWAHFSAQCSLFRLWAGKTASALSNTAFLVNVVTFGELGKFKRFFQTFIFIGGLEGRFGEHQKGSTFTLLHFLGRCDGSR